MTPRRDFTRAVRQGERNGRAYGRGPCGETDPEWGDAACNRVHMTDAASWL